MTRIVWYGAVKVEGKCYVKVMLWYSQCSGYMLCDSDGMEHSRWGVHVV